MFIRHFLDARWSIVEFIKAVSKKDHPIPNQDEDRQELWETFRFFDKDGDGFISLFDLQDTLCHLGLKVKAGDVYQMIHQADKNGDCRIDINGELFTFFSLYF